MFSYALQNTPEWLMTWWPALVAVAAAIVPISGVVSSYITQWSKRRIGWDDFQAQILAWILSGVFAIVQAVAAGQIVPELFSDLPALVVLVVGLFAGTARSSQRYHDLALKGKSGSAVGDGR